MVGLLGILVIIMVWTAAGPSKSPSEVVTTFYELANEGKFSQATEYMSSDLIRNYETSGRNIGLSMAKETRNGAIKDMKIISENINGEIATVQLQVDWEDGSPTQTANLNLINEEGEWKLTMKKNYPLKIETGLF